MHIDQLNKGKEQLNDLFGAEGDCCAVVGIGKLGSNKVAMVRMILQDDFTMPEEGFPKKLGARHSIQPSNPDQPMFMLLAKDWKNPIFLAVDWSESCDEFMARYKQTNIYVLEVVSPKNIIRAIVDNDDVCNHKTFDITPEDYSKHLEDFYSEQPNNNEIAKA